MAASFWRCILAASTRAEEIDWYTNADDAWEVVDAQQVPMIVLVTRPGCPHCVRMKNGTLRDPRVVQEVNESFVALHVDQQTDPAFVRELGIKAFPTVLILSPDDQLIDRIKGHITADQARQRFTAARRTTTAARTSNRER